MGCNCGANRRRPMTGRRVTPAGDTASPAAVTAAASGSWNVRLPDGSMHPEGPFRSLLRAQRAARGGGTVVTA